jgi:hypothetical protein
MLWTTTPERATEVFESLVMNRPLAIHPQSCHEPPASPCEYHLVLATNSFGSLLTVPRSVPQSYALNTQASQLSKAARDLLVAAPQGDFAQCVNLVLKGGTLRSQDTEKAFRMEAVRALKVRQDAHASNCIEKAVLVRICCRLTSSNAAEYYRKLYDEDEKSLAGIRQLCDAEERNCRNHVSQTQTQGNYSSQDPRRDSGIEVSTRRDSYNNADRTGIRNITSHMARTTIDEEAIEDSPPMEDDRAPRDSRPDVPERDIGGQHGFAPARIAASNRTVPGGESFRYQTVHMSSFYSSPPTNPRLNADVGSQRTADAYQNSRNAAAPNMRTTDTTQEAHDTNEDVWSAPDVIRAQPSVATNRLSLDGYHRRNAHEAARTLTVGRVFAVISYHDFDGDANDFIQTAESHLIPDDDWWILRRVTRLIVVDERHGSCLAVPISTYGGKGLAKFHNQSPLVNKHAVIYDEKKNPCVRRTEPRSDKRAIAVKCDPGQTLDEMSRVDMHKFKAVEHNVRFLRIGRVSAGSMEHFKRYFRDELPRDREGQSQAQDRTSAPSARGREDRTSASAPRDRGDQASAASTRGGGPRVQFQEQTQDRTSVPAARGRGHRGQNQERSRGDRYSTDHGHRTR